MKSRTTIWDYVLRGVAIGFLFPIGSIACCVFLFSEITVVHNLQTLHKQFPLLWIIDSAPLVLGTISFIVGNSVTKANKEFAIKIEEANTKLLDNLQIINKFSISFLISLSIFTTCLIYFLLSLFYLYFYFFISLLSVFFINHYILVFCFFCFF